MTQLQTRLRAAVSRVSGRSKGGRQQTLTLAVQAETVLEAWRDPQVLSRLLGDLGSVESTEHGQRWTITGAGTYDTTLSEHDGTAAYDGGGLRAELSVRPAPQDLGSEVRLVLAAPGPGLVQGAAAFTVLYRLRALLMTGEIPTLGPLPAAR